MSPFSCSWCCVYTHTATYLTNHRDGKERASERERARASESARDRESERGRERKAHTDKALLPDSRQPSFPYLAKYNSANAATGSILPGWGSVAKVYGAEQDCWQINTSVPAGSTFLIYVTGCWNALFQTVHMIIINTFFVHISMKRRNVSAILLRNLIALTHAGKV